MCAIGLPVAMGKSAAPSIIGPASALFRPQKSHSTRGCAGDELSSIVTLVTPDQRQRSARDRQISQASLWLAIAISATVSASIKLSEGRLLGRFYAANRARLREVAAELGVHHLANLTARPVRPAI